MFRILRWLLIWAIMAGVGIYWVWFRDLSNLEKRALKRELIESIDKGEIEPIQSKVKESLGKKFDEVRKEAKDKARIIAKDWLGDLIGE